MLGMPYLLLTVIGLLVYRSLKIAEQNGMAIQALEQQKDCTPPSNHSERSTA